MRTKLIATTLFTLSAMVAGSASAQTIRPGLWEINATMPGKMPPAGAMTAQIEAMKKQMANMPPEQRKEMEKMLASMEASGTEFTANGVRTKQCVTKEDIAKFQLLPQKDANGCTRTTSGLKTSDVTMNMKCPQPPMTMQARFKLQNEKAYSFESTTTVTGPTGKPETHKSSGTGKWLSDNCGAVKPASEMNRGE